MAEGKLVAEIEGAELDYWVALAEGFIAKISDVCGKRLTFRLVDDPSPIHTWVHFRPSTDWSQGGPIIERERINTVFLESAGLWTAGYGTDMRGLGPTPLVAAMRAFVASKLGEMVEVVA